jgi:hypothetical protein
LALPTYLEEHLARDFPRQSVAALYASTLSAGERVAFINPLKSLERLGPGRK